MPSVLGVRPGRHQQMRAFQDDFRAVAVRV